MATNGWKYYKRAAVPVCAPHETADTAPIKDGTIWNIEGHPILARWTDSWDCDHATSFWYVIKDTPLDIASLKSKRRYEINKGRRNFDVRLIDPAQYADELYAVTVAAYSGWPEKYRPHEDESKFKSDIAAWKDLTIFGAFNTADGKMAGYVRLNDRGSYVDFSVLRTRPEMEKLGVNAAMVAGILDHYADRLAANAEGPCKFYICDGARSMVHETAFQDYLEKYFGFRKAYCRIHIKYRPPVAAIVRLLYPLRNVLIRFDGIGSIHSINGVLKMEETARDCRG